MGKQSKERRDEDARRISNKALIETTVVIALTNMEARGQVPVQLPRAHPTISYWQEPPASIADHRTTSGLPASADYVIIGSGISGASIARNLLAGAPDASVLMLEARQTCSGATGRNGSKPVH